jgi:hypothetical protein
MLGVSASVVPLIGETSLLLMKFTKSLTKLSQSMNEAASSFATERVQHIHMVKSHAREEDATLLSAFYVGGKAVSRGELKQESLTSFVSYAYC